MVAADIPTGASMGLKSNLSQSSANSLPLPSPAPTETKLKRDDWMLLDSIEPTLPQTSSSPPLSTRMVTHPDNDASLTEDYGEPTESRRALSGGVDFFSSLGTERKKNRPEKPDPSKVGLVFLSTKRTNTAIL